MKSAFSVRGYLENEGYQLMSWQSDPDVDPSIWFVGDSKGPEWVVVRPSDSLEEGAERPANWDAIAAQSRPLSNIGHFASVWIASAEQLSAPEDDPAIPLWRGHQLEIEFFGLE